MLWDRGGRRRKDMSTADPDKLIVAALDKLLPEDQTGLMVLAMAAYIRNCREAGWTEAEIETNLRGLCAACVGRLAGVAWRADRQRRGGFSKRRSRHLAGRHPGGVIREGAGGRAKALNTGLCSDLPRRLSQHATGGNRPAVRRHRQGCDGAVGGDESGGVGCAHSVTRG